MKYLEPRRACAIAMVFFALTGCGKTSNPDSPYRAKVIVSTAEGYKLDTVTFTTLTDVDRVQGSLGEILGNAALDADAEVSELINPSSKDSIFAEPGKTVRLDYDVQGGVIYPKNFDSMAMLTIYYNYEQVFDYWQTNYGLTLSEFETARLFYAPRIAAKSGGTSLSGTIKVNAAFLPGLRDFFFFKTSPFEEIPVNMNLAVMAHEFAHGLFDLLVAQKEASFYLTDSSENEEQLSGMNEGIADFFAYMVTERPDEIAASISSVATERTLPVSWTYSTLSAAQINGTCNGSFYCKGSILASALYEIATSENQTALKVGSVVYSALQDFHQDWVDQKNASGFDYHYLIGRIVSRADSADKSVYCTSFQKWFDKSAVSENIGCES